MDLRSFKKFKYAAALLAAIAVCAVFSGCGYRDAEAQNELKEQGIAAMDSGDYAGAAKLFQDALDESVGIVTDSEIDICYYKAQAEYLSGDTESAKETYTNLIEYDEDNWKPYYLRGCLLAGTGDTDAARADFEKAFSLSDVDTETKISAYYMLGDYDTALSLANEAGGTDNSSMLLILAQNELTAGNTDTAIGYFEQVISLGDETGEARKTLISVYEDKLDFNTAYSYATSYLESFPDDESVKREAEFLATRIYEAAEEGEPDYGGLDAQ